MSIIGLNQERSKEVDRILIKAINCDSTEQLRLYSQVMILMRDFPEMKKQQTEQIAKNICGERPTQEQQSIIYTLLDKYEPFKDKINKLLATKTAEAIKAGSISKRSIEFLSSITDRDLEILKGQFKYILQLPHQNIRSGLSSKDLVIC